MQSVASLSVEGFQARAKEVPQREAAEDSGVCDPSFCRTYRVFLVSEDLGGQADSGKEVTQPVGSLRAPKGHIHCPSARELGGATHVHSFIYQQGKTKGLPLTQEISTGLTPPQALQAATVSQMRRPTER